MNSTVIIVVAGLAASAALYTSLPLRKRSLQKKAGACILPVTGKSKSLTVLLFLCPLLIVLLLIRNLELYVQIVICGVALLGMEMAVREKLVYECGGVYEHAVVGGGRCIMYDEMLSFPVLQMPKAERKNYDACSLYIATKTHGTVQIHYADETECETVTKAVFEQEKRLRPW